MSLRERQNKFIHQIFTDEQMNIYQQNYIGQLQKTLKQIYPVCCKLVGDIFFASMTKKFIYQTPSHSPDLSTYGKSFPEFIQHFKPAQSLGYLSDVAKLEWAWHRIYYSADADIFDFPLFEKTSEKEKIIFVLPPESFLLTSPYPLHTIWQTNHTESSDDIQLTDHEIYYFFIWRNQLELRLDVISESDSMILSWIQTGSRFDKLCDNIQQFFPEIAISELLPQWISKGWISSFIPETGEL